jgi:lipoprotein-anchoring transpeptidase ErfK/SrfK
MTKRTRPTIRRIRHHSGRALVITAGLLILASGCGGGSGPTFEASPTTETTAAAPKLGPGISQVATVKPASIPLFGQAGDAAPLRSDENPWHYGDAKGPAVPRVYLVKDNDTNKDFVEVYLSSRPNGSTAWVRRSDVAIESNHFRIEVHLAAFKLQAFEDDRSILDAPIALGTDDAPTPGGKYYANIVIKSTDPAYGPFAIGLSGHSELLQDFNGGDGQLGLHGTDHPELIGTRVSHGCIRLTNENITKLANQLPLGTPIVVMA